MNKVLIFFSGLCMGAAAGWFASKYYYDKKASEVIFNGKDRSEEVTDKEQSKETEKEEKEETPQFTPEEKSEIMTSYRDILDVTNYSAAVEEDDTDELEEEETPKKPSKCDIPYVVTHLQWGEPNAYEKNELVYYEGDGVLATYDDEKFESEFAYTGIDFISEYDDENDIAYVRNDYMRMDFEITRDPRAYKEVRIRGL